MDVTLDHARTLITACRAVVDGAAARLAADSTKDGRVDLALMDREQVLAYDLSSIASQVTAAEEMLEYGDRGSLEAMLTVAFAGDVAAGLAARMEGRQAAWGVDGDWLDGAREAYRLARSPELLDAIADAVLANPQLPRHLSEDLDLARQTFRDYADAKVRPVAEHVHRNDEDIPEDIITGLAEMGMFGLSIPEKFGGFAQGESEDDFMSMVVVTEELSRGSLGVAGSLITRPEIVGKALVKGGTDEQQQRWLPRIASGELMCGVAVTEPDYGSDVASLKVTAKRDGDFYVINGVKTWCTFAGRANLLGLLARTGAPEDRHKGLSLFIVEKPSYAGHEFTHDGEHGGRMEARAIGTIGYRGMHSFEISFDGYRVPADNLVGGDDKLGKGFYLQMDAFANGRLQTAARALGVMQAAFEDAVSYANSRHVFGVPLASYQLTRAKLARMAFLIAACRRFAYRSAQLLGKGEGQLEASMVKSFSCLAAEWLTREAMQIHGGMGYAEEYAVSRYFVDARVLSIFEGADETLALRVIIRRLLEQAA
ncbi:MAG TPA: acyl-CoA dehydrogenase family protein [Egibacteraceae bacterium]|nr:acyl-CoA dehydrogenase family protein [Egibacteraceae bacterium]